MTREEAIKTLRELCRETNESWYEETYNMAIEALSADRPTGKWKEKIIKGDSVWTRHRYYCSVCGGWNTYGKSDYCPNCGVRMCKGGDSDG